ncbi:MAG: hypothetical protein WAW26_02575 [Anaerolineae bacterium]|uniref:hypothetical protein n=1 Tax=Candidatus Amarolinea dominans TaxID=3140696 RepID=UPI0031CC5EF6
MRRIKGSITTVKLALIPILLFKISRDHGQVAEGMVLDTRDEDLGRVARLELLDDKRAEKAGGGR